MAKIPSEELVAKAVHGRPTNQERDDQEHPSTDKNSGSTFATK